MARLIDADILLGKLSRMIDYCREDLKVNGLTALFQVGDAIMDCKSFDAVEVVRCKDCIRRYDTDECPMCYLFEGQYYEYTNGNGYCDRGERKDGVDDADD